MIHFWFKQWPDYGIPETGIPIITLLLDSRTYARNSQSPILVHCSSGILIIQQYVGLFVLVCCSLNNICTWTVDTPYWIYLRLSELLENKEYLGIIQVV